VSLGTEVFMQDVSSETHVKPVVMNPWW